MMQIHYEKGTILTTQVINDNFFLSNLNGGGNASIIRYTICWYFDRVCYLYVEGIWHNWI